MHLRSHSRRCFSQCRKKRGIIRKRLLAGGFLLVLVLLLSRWLGRGPLRASPGSTEPEKLRVVGKLNNLVRPGHTGHLIEVLPTTGSLGVVIARFHDKRGQVQELFQGCFAVRKTDTSTANAAPQPVYVRVCPADEEKVTTSEALAETSSEYESLELWRHSLRSSPQESIWRRVGSGECLGVDTKTWQLVLGLENCIVWDEREKGTLSAGQIRLELQAPLLRLDRLRAKSLRNKRSNNVASANLPSAFKEVPEVLPWPLGAQTVRLESRTGRSTKALLLALDAPRLDVLAAISPAFRERHRSTIGMVTVRRYVPLSRYTPEDLQRTRFPPERMPPVDPKDRTIRYPAPASNVSSQHQTLAGHYVETKVDRKNRTLCLSVTSLADRTVDLLPCESKHDDPDGQHQVWNRDGQRIYTALSHELCLDTETQRKLLPCPLRNVTCGGVYATVASVILSFWRDPVYMPTVAAAAALSVDAAGMPSLSPEHEFIDKLHLFASNYPPDDEYLRVFRHNPTRINIHRWDEAFRDHLETSGAMPLERIQQSRHAIGTVNYYAALRGLDLFASPERDLVLLEDDVKAADDAWVNMLHTLRSIEHDLDSLAQAPNRRYSFPPNTSYAAQLYVPEKWHDPRLGWPYAFLEHSRIYGTQALVYPAGTRRRMVEHYLRGITQTQDPFLIPKYDLHLHDLDFPFFGLARSAFEHSGCASTGLGAGLHRSRTWTPCELVYSLERLTAGTTVQAVRSRVWSGTKRSPPLVTASDLNRVERAPKQPVRFELVVMDDPATETEEIVSRPIARYASLSSLLAAAWADGATTLDRLERIYFVGDDSGPIAHHQVMSMHPDAAACVEAVVRSPSTPIASEKILIFLQHQRPLFAEYALAFPDGWFTRLEGLIQRIRSSAAAHTNLPPLVMLGLYAKPSDGASPETVWNTTASNIYLDRASQRRWDDSVCEKLDLVVIAGAAEGKLGLLRQLLGSQRPRTLVELCRILQQSDLISPVLPDVHENANLYPVLETY